MRLLADMLFTAPNVRSRRVLGLKLALLRWQSDFKSTAI